MSESSEFKDYREFHELFRRLTPDAQRLAVTNLYQRVEILDEDEEPEEFKRILSKFDKAKKQRLQS